MMDNSTGMRLISWNINSVRLRERQLARLVRTYEPDVVCLQETKVRNELFPSGIVRNLGYAHQAVDGEKSYNGVAVLSRLPLTKKRTKRWAGQSDCRHLTITLPDGTESPQRVRAGGRRPSGSREKREVRAQAPLSARDGALVSPAPGRVEPVGPRRRSECRSAPDRRVVAREAPPSGHPHAGGGRSPCCARCLAGLGRCGATLRAFWRRRSSPGGATAHPTGDA